MEIKKETLVVIPARGGSKRIPKKNIKRILDKPMIIWTLQELRKIFDNEQLLVSTDDAEIKKVVEEFGINVPFKRPSKLADDHATTVEVANHALDWFERENYKVNYTLIIYPTAILLDTNELVKAYDFMKKNSEYSVFFSVIEYSHPIQRALKINKKNKMQMIFPENYNARTQDFDKSYHDAGQFYFCKSEIVRNKISLFKEKSSFTILPKTKAIDIDYMEDLKLAEQLILYNKRLK